MAEKTWFGHKRFIMSGLCQSACLSSTGVGSKFYISTAFITCMMYCMHCAGGRDCNPSPDGRYYVGNKSVTVSGRKCRAWTSRYRNDQFPDGSRAAAVNYCRRPTYWRDGLWCLVWTTDPDVTWEACNVSDCGQSLSYITRTFA